MRAKARTRRVSDHWGRRRARSSMARSCAASATARGWASRASRCQFLLREGSLRGNVTLPARRAPRWPARGRPRRRRELLPARARCAGERDSRVLQLIQPPACVSSGASATASCSGSVERGQRHPPDQSPRRAGSAPAGDQEMAGWRSPGLVVLGNERHRPRPTQVRGPSRSPWRETTKCGVATARRPRRIVSIIALSSRSKNSDHPAAAGVHARGGPGTCPARRRVSRAPRSQDGSSRGDARVDLARVAPAARQTERRRLGVRGGRGGIRRSGASECGGTFGSVAPLPGPAVLVGRPGPPRQRASPR